MQPNASDDSRKPVIPGSPHCYHPRITPRACPTLVRTAPHPTAHPATAPVARRALPLAPPTDQAPHPTRPARLPPVTATVATQVMRRTEEPVRLIRTLDSPLRLTSKTEPLAQPNPLPHLRHPAVVTPAMPRTVVRMSRIRLFRPRIRATAPTVCRVRLSPPRRLMRPQLAMLAPAGTRLPRTLPPARLTALTTTRS